MLRKLDVCTQNKLSPKSTTHTKLTPDDHRPQLRLPEETWQVWEGLPQQDPFPEELRPATDRWDLIKSEGRSTGNHQPSEKESDGVGETLSTTHLAED